MKYTNHLIRYFLIISVCTILLVGCTLQWPESLPSPESVTASTAPTIVVSIESPNVAPSPTNLPMPIATATQIPPTQTPAPTPTFTVTSLPTSTTTPNPTATTVVMSGPELENLDGFLWQNRLIVVFTDSSRMAEFETQFAAEDYAIVDRHILWFIVVDNRVTTNYMGRLSSWLASNLRDRYSRLSTSLEVVLIGKDGGVKSRQPFLDSSAIYWQIDQMPMRRAEMREQN